MIAFGLAPTVVCAEDRPPVIIYAAASLSGALTQLWPPQRHPEVRLSFASSSLLARQIAAGAPADIYVSAHSAWMDTLREQGHIEPASRRDIASNRLALITTTQEPLTRPTDAGDLVAQLGSARSRLAIADPDHVPAGMYARQALRALGWWEQLSPMLAPAPDARAALALVERGACAAGIVYASDAHTSRRVRVLTTLPDSLHADIRYPAALVRQSDSPAAGGYLDTLQSAAARRALTDHGFLLIGDGR